jgi:hypothetical protein
VRKNNKKEENKFKVRVLWRKIGILHKTTSEGVKRSEKKEK